MTRRMEKIVCGDLLVKDEVDACVAACSYTFDSIDAHGSSTTIAQEAVTRGRSVHYTLHGSQFGAEFRT